MARVLLVSFAGYPYTPSSLMPDNGLANLAGCLLDAGHDARVLDYGTTETMARLYPRRIHRRMKPLVEAMLAGRKMRLRDVLTAAWCERSLRRHQRRVHAELADEILRQADAFGADAIGFKLWNGDGFGGTARIAERIRRRRPSLALLGGGPHVDWFRAEILNHTRVFDALVLGEGEAAIAALADYVDGRRPLREVPNLLYRRGGRLCRTHRAAVENLDDLPMPRYQNDVYPSLHGRGQIKLVTLDESRGCPCRCAFCLHGAKSGQQWRFKSPARVVGELRAVREVVGSGCFIYAGSNTPTRPAAQNAHAILNAGLDVRYACFAHVKSMARADMPLLSASGCRAIFLGLESASRRILAEAMDKQVPLDKARDMLSRMREAGIASVVSVIHPAPFEDALSTLETIDFLLQTRPDSVPVQFPGLIPGTRWDRKASAYGFGFPAGRANARRVGLTYKIKLLYPPRLWPKLPYTLAGQSSRQLIRRTGEFIRHLEAEGLTTGVGHDLALMARELNEPLRGFRDECRKIFLSGDVDRAQDLVGRINEALCGSGRAAGPAAAAKWRMPKDAPARTQADSTESCAY